VGLGPRARHERASPRLCLSRVGERMCKGRMLDGLLRASLPPYHYPPLSRGERGLVIGMGGGCDVFASWALAQEWAEAQPEGEVLYAAASSERYVAKTKTELPDSHITHLVEGAYSLGGERVPLQPGDDAYGTVKLELSVPRGPHGSPLVFCMPKSDNVAGMSLAEVQKGIRDRFNLALEKIGPISHILGVDCGGDSVTGGIDHSGDMEMGRDRQVLHALGACGVPFDHVILGPACDGESSEEQMIAALDEIDHVGALAGLLNLGHIAMLMRECTEGLKPMRTPNIIWTACERKRLIESNVPEAHLPEWARLPIFTIMRHNRVQAIPWSWLTVGVVIRGAGALRRAPAA